MSISRENGPAFKAFAGPIVFSLAAGMFAMAGCADASTATVESDAESPDVASAESETAAPAVDGPVEVLMANAAGEIEHKPSTFQEALKAEGKVVVVDFWATWCGPCKMLAPELEKIVSENDDIVVVKVDVDQAEDLAYHYKASAIPDVRVFKEGKQVEQIVGFKPADQLLPIIRGSGS